MLFYMLQSYPNIKRAIISDINPLLVNTYEVVRSNVEELIESLQQKEATYIALDTEERKEYFLQVRTVFNQGRLSSIEKAAWMIFLNKTCFNGLYRVNAKGEFNVPHGRYSNPKICDAETLRADSLLLQRVEIRNGDFETLQQEVDRNSFVYLDPPYRPLSATSNFNSYVKEPFNDDEQVRLKKFTDKLSEKGCQWMLSNSDGKSVNPADDFFDSLYKKYVIERVYASRAVNAVASKRGKVSELLIKNYSPYNAHTII